MSFEKKTSRSKRKIDDSEEIDDVKEAALFFESLKPDIIKLDNEADLVNRFLLILHSSTDSAFFETSNFYKSMYVGKSCFDRNIKVQSATTINLRHFLTEHYGLPHKLVIHYIGHGVNTSSKDNMKKFPDLLFDDGRFDLTTKIKLSKMDVTVIIDACNNISTRNEVRPAMSYAGTDILFQLSGVNIITSSKIGYFSYFSRRDQLTFFSRAFSETAINPYNSIEQFVFDLNVNMMTIRDENNLPIPEDGVIIDCEFASGDFDIREELDHKKMSASMKRQKKSRTPVDDIEHMLSIDH